MAWGAEPRDRERSPGRGPEDPGRRAVAAVAQRHGVCSSEDHLGISSADFGLIRGPTIAGKGSIGWGQVS
jgi:hypothetical protein